MRSSSSSSNNNNTTLPRTPARTALHSATISSSSAHASYSATHGSW